MSSLKQQQCLQTELIIAGYIKDIQILFPYKSNPFYIIPADIMQLTLLYLYNYYSNDGTYKWRIDDTKMVKTMLNAECGEKFQSMPFEMARLDWKLEIYPNGVDIETMGYFVIYLYLLSLPSIIDQIQICRTFRVMENMSGSTWIATLSENEYEFWGKKCSLKELMNTNTITILVEVIINKIVLKNDVDIPPNISIDTTDDGQYQNKQRLQYILTGHELNSFKKSECFKEMSGNIENMWSLSWNPNGMDERSKGYIGLFLNICRFPPNAVKLKVRFEIGCIETGWSTSYNWHFTEGSCGYGDMYLMKLQDALKYDILTFYAEFQILDVIKENKSLEIWDEMVITQLLSHQNKQKHVQHLLSALFLIMSV